MAELTDKDPYSLFQSWLDEASEKEINDPTAMALASVGADGMPSLRMVLMKDFDEKGFVFYTNLESRKGQELLNHPKATLLFHWKSLRRQVRVEGHVELVNESDSDDYFATRPRLSQIGAWASKQSRPLKNRQVLEMAAAKFTAKYNIGAVPRPPYWSGFLIKPIAFEFWQDGAFRLHDRWRFYRLPEKEDNHESPQWGIERLYP